MTFIICGANEASGGSVPVMDRNACSVTPRARRIDAVVERILEGPEL